MATNKRVFTLRLSDEVFDKIGALATREHRSITNYIEFVLLKHLEEVEKAEGTINVDNSPKGVQLKMSVLKQKRTTSKAEFINTANQIYVETLNFLTRLSARYSRLIAEPVAKLAGEIIDHAEKANSIFPSDNQRIEMRKAHLLEARASLMALDVRLTHVYLILNQNPEGAFTTSKGSPVKSQDAMEKLDKMAQNLGELIDKENELLKGAIKNVTAKQK